MSSSTPVSSGVGAEDQNPIYSYSGIDLFVNLEIHSSESRQIVGLTSQASYSDAPKPVAMLSHVSNNVVEEVQLTTGSRRHNWTGNGLKSSWENLEMASRTGGKSCWMTIDRKELDEDRVMQFEQVAHQGSQHIVSNETSMELEQSSQVSDRGAVPDGRAGKFLAGFFSSLPSEGQIVGDLQCLNTSHQASITNQKVAQKSNDHPEKRCIRHDQENLCDPSGSLCGYLECGLHSQENIVRGFQDLVINWKGRQVVEEEDLALYKARSSLDKLEGPYICNENRMWSPHVDDYSCLERTVDMGTESDNRMTGCVDDSTCLGEGSREGLDPFRATSSSFVSENEVVGRMELEQAGNPNLETLSHSSPEIETCDEVEVLAALGLLELSGAYLKLESTEQAYIREFMDRELSAIRSARDVLDSEFRAASNQAGKLAKLTGKTHATVLKVDVSTTTNALKPGSEKLEHSLRGDDDRHTPRVVRAKARSKGSKFSTRLDFVNECDDESDSEVLQRSPRKRRYKSTQELYREHRSP